MNETSLKSPCKLTSCREKKKSKPLNLVVDWFQEEVKNFNMVEPKTHSNPWHLNPHKTITNTTEYWSPISTPNPFLYINLTKQLVFKNHNHHHQVTVGFLSEKKASDLEREPFSLRSTKSSSPSGFRAGSNLSMAKRALSRKGLKAISIACHPNARAPNTTTACSWKLEREKKNDFWGGELVCTTVFATDGGFLWGKGSLWRQGRGGVMLGRVRLINYLYSLAASGFYDFLVDLVWFVGFITKTKTEPDLLKFIVLKIGLIGFSSRFGFFGWSVFLNTPKFIL